MVIDFVATSLVEKQDEHGKSLLQSTLQENILNMLAVGISSKQFFHLEFQYR